MILTKTDIEKAFSWGQPKELNTKRGLRIMRKAPDSPEAKAFWTANQPQLAAMGVVFALKWQSQTEHEFVWWQEVPRDVLAKREENKELSRATDADIDVPCPEGRAFLPYQRAGVKFMQDKPGVLLGDEMGLGKTIQALGTINLIPEIHNVFVVCPAKLKLNWYREARVWLIRPFNIEIISADWSPSEVKWAMERHMGTGPADLFEKNGKPTAGTMLIVNYDIVARYECLTSFFWDFVILDEAHRLKNPKAKRTRSVFGHRPTSKERADGIEGNTGIAGRRRACLTGTPIPNRIIEMWPMLQYLDPVTYNSWWHFVKNYCDGRTEYFGEQSHLNVNGASRLPELQAKLRSTVMIRRKKCDVLKELPPKRRSVIPIPAETEEQRRVLAREKEATRAWDDRIAELEAKVMLAKADENVDSYTAAVKALGEASGGAFAEMSKIRHDTAVAKLPLVIAFVEDLLEQTDKVIVLTYHRDVTEAIEKAFSGVGSLKIYGGMKDTDSQRAVDLFQNDPNYRVIALSIPVAVGMTLTAASHVVAAEGDWVPGNMTQAEDRAHRIGTVNPVNVYHLVLEGSLDHYMAEVCCDKQAVIDAALDTVEAAVERNAPVSHLGAQRVKATRRDLEQDAVTMTDAQRRSILAALKSIAGLCDGAHQKDGAGFSQVDALIGHSLATQMFLTPRQAALGRRLVQKYKRQLPPEVVASCSEL